ncbi:hypothetical protein [Arachidicoccus terrestris]|uniref:hypothetical protein n=1 Tax=Arachidicoccus terrestris TaxID=2875539 RepID=UPI001CC37521|nr:hypothetical protein [Arachidicoccus terrestris]UAY55659.1 hypothetical protein K9M52_01100 [Arachidicoccus terrestris]
MMDINQKSPACKDLVHQIISCHPGLPVIAISGNPKIQSIVKKLGLAAFLLMPFMLKELYHIVENPFAGQALKCI